MKRVLLLAATMAAAAFCVSAALADEFDPLRNALKSAHMGFYRPVNSVYGAGWVYRMERDEQGNKYPVTLCADAYGGVPNHTVEHSGQILASGVTTQSNDMNFSLSLLEKLLRNLASATLGFRRSGLTQATIDWGPIATVELSPRYMDDGTSRQVSASCTQNLRPYVDANGHFTTDIYIVRRVAVVRHLVYHFVRRASSGGGAGSGGATPAAGSTPTPSASHAATPAAGGAAPAAGAAGTPAPAAGAASGGAAGANNQPSTATDASATAAISLKDLLDFSANVTFSSGSDLGFTVDIPAGQSPIVVGANAVKLTTWAALASTNTQATVATDSSDEADPDVYANAP